MTTSATLVNGVPNGNILPDDRGLQYGDGVFETIAVCQGQPLLWTQHLERLVKGCKRLAIRPPESSLLHTEVATLSNGVKRGIIKIILTRGPSPRGYRISGTSEPTRIIIFSPWPGYPITHANNGVTVRLCRTHLSRNPQLAGIKHLNRLEQVLARSEWDEEDAEGLMQDSDGNIIEGTMTNVFMATKGVLTTPDLTQAGVEGVMRAQLLECADKLAISNRIEPIKLEQLFQAEEVFLSNCIIGIWPVIKLANKVFHIGGITQRLQNAIVDRHCFREMG